MLPADGDSAAGAILGLGVLREQLQVPNEEVAGDLRRLLALLVHPVVQLAHRLVGDLSGQQGQYVFQLGIFRQRLSANQGGGIVAGKESPVVLQHHQAVGDDAAIGGEGVDHVHGAVRQHFVHQPGIHLSGFLWELEPVMATQPLVAVRPHVELGVKGGTAAVLRGEYCEQKAQGGNAARNQQHAAF